VGELIFLKVAADAKNGNVMVEHGISSARCRLTAAGYFRDRLNCLMDLALPSGT
jgi:hypothetical protein